jgi:hypothetical protein
VEKVHVEVGDRLLVERVEFLRVRKRAENRASTSISLASWRKASIFVGGIARDILSASEKGLQGWRPYLRGAVG